MKEESYNEKKPENLIKIRNTRIVRYIVVDHCSGNFYLRYEQAAGEDAKGFLDTLIDAITDRGPQDVMHGVPEILYTDPGPGPASSLVTGFCGQMGSLRRSMCREEPAPPVRSKSVRTSLNASSRAAWRFLGSA